MKTALIFFKPVERDFDGEYYQKVVFAFKSGGINIDAIDIIATDDERAFRHRVDEFRDIFDNLLVINCSELKFDLKEIIAEKFETALAENENAKSFLDAVCKSDGIDYDQANALLPIEATVIPNIKGAFQGFILDQRQFTLVCLPEEYQQIKVMCDKYVLPYIENKFGIKSKRLILKYFGDKKALDKILDKAKQICESVKINVYEKYGDYSIDLLFDNSNTEIENQVVRFIVSELKENIYAEFDTSLGERLFDLLRLKNLKISVAESFTGGRVVSEIIKNPGASSFVQEGIVSYSNQSKIKRLGVNDLDLHRSGAVSSVVAYQMAVGLLRAGDCDIAISTTGIAGPKSDDTEKPVGLCYVAVGMKNGVHSYKLNLTGNREEITETAKNTALFLAIKKLKKV